MKTAVKWGHGVSGAKGGKSGRGWAAGYLGCVGFRGKGEEKGQRACAAEEKEMGRDKKEKGRVSGPA